jgi:hypothetical protein
MKTYRIKVAVLGAFALLALASQAWAGGWYLMEPPFTVTKHAATTKAPLSWTATIDTKAPLSGWTIMHPDHQHAIAFYEEDDCESARLERIGEALTAKYSPYLQPIYIAGTQDDASVAFATDRVCVATDDPRLAR